MKPTFHFQTSTVLKDRKKLKSFIYSIFLAENSACDSLSYIFCDDDYLLNINRDFLQHDYYTDIITFNLASTKQPIEGEIYISVDTVRTNAERFNVFFNNELHRVIFHGVLHLCGYKDKSIAQQKLMRSKEDYYLKQYFEE